MAHLLIVIYLVSPGGYATTVSVHMKEISGFSSVAVCDKQKPGFVKEFEGSIPVPGADSKTKPVVAIVRAKCFSKE